MFVLKCFISLLCLPSLLTYKYIYIYINAHLNLKKSKEQCLFAIMPGNDC